MYSDGQGVIQNYKEGLEWYRKAAEQGNADAQFNLGLKYIKGEGVPQDYIKACKWFNLAATQNNKYTEFKDKLEAEITKEQIMEAQKLAMEFVPRKRNK